jgi:glycine/D-amino acid oxidase-like deaminating enzyme/nitrite reductase/ring-hydroxylating ferredoxin subunit
MSQLDTTPYWMSVHPRSFSKLEQDLDVDVVVVGAGITGITAAFLMKAAGLRVALLERSRAASADTGHTTAHLTYVTDHRLSELVTHFGREHARAVWDAGRLAIRQIQSTIEAEDIACDFQVVPGYLHEPVSVGRDAHGSVPFRDEAALAKELGFDAAYLESVPFVETPGIRFEAQALFHPRKYLAGLLRAIPGDGSHVFEDTIVDDIGGDPLRVQAGAHTVQCDHVVIATHSPLMGKANPVVATLLQTKLALYTSYAIGGRVPAGRLPAGSFWDTADPYHYLRVDRQRGMDYVIFGGEDHKTGQVADTAGCFASLEATLHDLVPDIDLTHWWSGQVIETNDGLPYIGETAPRQFVATGFGGNGMTFGTLAGMMARDSALGRSNPWLDLFDVNRTKLRGGTWDYLTENKDYLYHLVRDRLSAPEGRSLDDLKPAEGKLLELDGQRIAAYRDQRGVVTLRSAVCTHMGCLVAWNTAERTWDCPCHGSRFTPEGDVISGPAERPLPEPDLIRQPARGRQVSS